MWHHYSYSSKTILQSFLRFYGQITDTYILNHWLHQYTQVDWIILLSGKCWLLGEWSPLFNFNLLIVDIITLFILVNKDHFYRWTFTTHILHYYIQCSALQWIVICILPGWRVREGGLEQRRKRSGREQREVVIVKLFFWYFFFLTTVQFVLEKLNP